MEFLQNSVKNSENFGKTEKLKVEVISRHGKVEEKVECDCPLISLHPKVAANRTSLHNFDERKFTFSHHHERSQIVPTTTSHSPKLNSSSQSSTRAVRTTNEFFTQRPATLRSSPKNSHIDCVIKIKTRNPPRSSSPSSARSDSQQNHRRMVIINVKNTLKPTSTHQGKGRTFLSYVARHSSEYSTFSCDFVTKIQQWEVLFKRKKVNTVKSHSAIQRHGLNRIRTASRDWKVPEISPRSSISFAITSSLQSSAALESLQINSKPKYISLSNRLIFSHTKKKSNSSEQPLRMCKLCNIQQEKRSRILTSSGGAHTSAHKNWQIQLTREHDNRASSQSHLIVAVAKAQSR
jgi:hypothetical protein